MMVKISPAGPVTPAGLGIDDGLALMIVGANTLPSAHPARAARSAQLSSSVWLCVAAPAWGWQRTLPSRLPSITPRSDAAGTSLASESAAAI
jgi:hypothetical protein